jgi:hypothetical protein
MKVILLFGIFIVFYREDGELLKNYILINNGGIFAGFSLNRTDSKWGDNHDTEPIATGGYEGSVWKIFNFKGYLSSGAVVNFKESKIYTSGLYSDTSIPGLVIYKSIEHKEEGEEIGAKIPFYLKIFKNLTINSSIGFSWRKAFLQHGEGESYYSMEIMELSASELNLTGRIGCDLRTNFFNFSFFLGIPLFLRGDAEMLRYSLKEKGATVIVEPGIQWSYDPKPPPLIKTLLGFRYGDISLILTHSFTPEWGGGFVGIDRTQYRLDGVHSHDIGVITSYRFIQNEFLLGFNYEGMDYKTENIPALNGDRFLVLIGYKRESHPPYGLFLQCLLSDMDYKFIRNLSVFLTRITMNFFIGF